MEFRLLGPVELRVDGAPVALAGQLPRALLAVLLVHANRVVATERLIASLWGSTPPRTARGVLQNQVWRLRRALAGSGRHGRLVSQPPGYLLRVDPGELDLEVFGRLADQGRVALAAGEAEDAGRLLRMALELWRGRPFEDVEVPALADRRARLEERRLAAVEDRVEADLARGRHADVVA
ncbi:MAG TPA: BTAD domain-containing putative transcriptional regulator, partial [Actinomycetota bacterium]|nr:BTAD domain-containing putative transcriptional regulator [Actinomycetota bacterium]